MSSGPDRLPEHTTTGKWYYTGISMGPTLRSGDVLDVDSSAGVEVRCGDVVVLGPIGAGQKYVIHRVVSTRGGAIVTQGDNNTTPDAMTFSRADVVGKVTHACGDRGRRRVVGGLRGRVRARVLRLRRVVHGGLRTLLRPVYKVLELPAWAGLLPRPAGLRVISIRRESGEEHKLLWGRRTIGRRLPGESRWRIRRPFKLFVDETALPCPARHDVHTANTTMS
jgi:hypothetical protein